MNRNQLRIESLEKRQLFDADVCMLSVFDATVLSQPAMRFAAFPGDVVQNTVSVNGSESAENSSALDLRHSIEGTVQTSIAYAGAQVVRSGSTVATVTTIDASGKQALWILDEDGSEGAEITFQVDLGNLFVENMLADGDRLLVIGTDRGPHPWFADSSEGTTGIPDSRDLRFPWFPPQKVVAVDLSSGEIVDEIMLAPGFLKYADFADGEAVFLLNRMDLIVPAIWPPVETQDEIYRFRWDESGLGDVRKDQIPSGHVTSVASDRIVIAAHKYSDSSDGILYPTSIEIRSFKLTDNGVEATGTVDIGPGYLDSLKINSTGTQAIVIRSQYTLTLEAQRKPSEVIIVDLSGDSPSVIDTVVVEARSQAISQDDDYVLFYDHGESSLILVSLLDAVQGNARISTVEVPENLALRPQVNRLSDNRLVMLGTESVLPDGRILAANSLVPEYYRSPTTLVTLSLSATTLQLQPIGGESRYRSLHIIDPQTSRMGFQTELVDSDGAISSSFIFGTLDGEGRFIVEGEITTDKLGHFYVDESKLTIATQTELTVYEYTTPDTPLYQILLVDQDSPPLTAVNDQAIVYRRDPSENWFGPELVDLLANDQISFALYGRTRIVDLIDAPDGISIVGHRYIGVVSDAFTDGQVIEFRYRISDGISESEATVKLTIEKRPDDINPGESIVELSLVATNLAGEPVNVVEPGASFWLELRGMDLRSFGQGLFSAFFSLETSDAITFDGTVEAGEGFTLVQADRLSDKISGSTIRGLGVIDSDGSPSGHGAKDSKVLLRVRATANRADALVLMPMSSRDATQEIAVFGNNEALRESQINRLAISLPIVDEAPHDPSDVDGNGSVQALDALRVINMISRYGTGTVEAITTKMNEGSSALLVSAVPLDASRFDVNGSGAITPLDALVIINEMSRRRRLSAGHTEASPGSVTNVYYGLTKTGSGTLTLSGSTTYTGTTSLSDGTLTGNGFLNQLGSIKVNEGSIVLNSVESELSAKQSAPTPLVVASVLRFNTLSAALTSNDGIEEKQEQDERDAFH